VVYEQQHRPPYDIPVKTRKLGLSTVFRRGDKDLAKVGNMKIHNPDIDGKSGDKRTKLTDKDGVTLDSAQGLQR